MLPIDLCERICISYAHINSIIMLLKTSKIFNTIIRNNESLQTLIQFIKNNNFYKTNSIYKFIDSNILSLPKEHTYILAYVKKHFYKNLHLTRHDPCLINIYKLMNNLKNKQSKHYSYEFTFNVNNPYNIKLVLCGHTNTIYKDSLIIIDLYYKSYKKTIADKPSISPYIPPMVVINSPFIHPYYINKTLCIDILNEAWSPLFINLNLLVIALYSILDVTLTAEQCGYNNITEDDILLIKKKQNQITLSQVSQWIHN